MWKWIYVKRRELDLIPNSMVERTSKEDNFIYARCEGKIPVDENWDYR